MVERITRHSMRRLDKKSLLRVVIFILALLEGLVLVGCTNQPVNQPSTALENTPGAVDTTTPTATEQPVATLTNTPQPDPTQKPISVERTAYNFTVDLDYNKHHLVVRQTIQYQNNTGQALTEIKLVVPPNAKANVFSLTSISGDAGIADYSLEGVTLTIQLDHALAIDDSISIAIDYELSPKLQGGVLGYTAKQINISDWYPFVPPYDATNGWIIHQPAEVGEYLVYDSADFDLILNLVDAAGLVVASSTEVAPLDLDSFKMVQKDSRGITFSVSDQYTVVTNTTSGVTVKGYVFAGDEAAGQASVDYTASAIQLYSELFGVPYPHQTMSVVESDFPDGMEYDGLYYLSDFYFKLYDSTPQNYLALLSIHETAHQWWFGIVGNDQALEPWLDESLATYSEYLYIERYYPELANWWWQYRVEYYKPAGRVNLTIYDQSDLRVYINAVYLQGATLIHQLRGAIGDDIFFSGISNYVKLYNHQIATWHDFTNELINPATDLTDKLLQQYFIP
ncbi:MAG: hypothetical protein C0410_01300 [Anaerolinea sp.]|nr:hypothetical protein [Anaerolinea sp.]